MNQEVTNYILKIPKWQIEVGETLRTMIYNTIPDIQERFNMENHIISKMVIMIV